MIPVSVKFSGVFTQQPNAEAKPKSFYMRNQEYWVTNDSKGQDKEILDNLSLTKKQAEEEAALKLSHNKSTQTKYEQIKKAIADNYLKGLAQLASKAQIG